jgi:hypothetical protein
MRNPHAERQVPEKTQFHNLKQANLVAKRPHSPDTNWDRKRSRFTPEIDAEIQELEIQRQNLQVQICEKKEVKVWQHSMEAKHREQMSSLRLSLANENAKNILQQLEQARNEVEESRWELKGAKSDAENSRNDWYTAHIAVRSAKEVAAQLSDQSKAVDSEFLAPHHSMELTYPDTKEEGEDFEEDEEEDEEGDDEKDEDYDYDCDYKVKVESDDDDI